ncbi:PREDICTED: OTU domain-containing protein 6B isoform X2 [Hipposideros armiger]|uniref:ubiquitinyl hydrolase 1 n=1 Tax=Hipposideros armiger TaxID=186990 RepID=A0A8B7QA13_HIPAR|nr:PREDICTED: OTU domain-containing protein 6B isoform X2 [Hipposideros armiger]
METVLAEGLDEEEELVRRHRKEKKELQAKIQGMKHAVPKNDKKRRKQLTDDVAKLEAEMEKKQREELEQLKLTSEQSKDKKAALEKKRKERIAEAEIENLSGARHVESEKLAEILAARQLEIKQIPSDGHCMYRAIEDQLKEQECPLTVAALRSQTAEYMQSHVEEFLPFLTNPNTGDMYTPEEFAKYCDDIINTVSWGGQLELRALSHILQTPIEIIQADSPPIVVGEEYPKKPLILVYMRHAYGLGEHYNSVTWLVNRATENCS